MTACASAVVLRIVSMPATVERTSCRPSSEAVTTSPESRAVVSTCDETSLVAVSIEDMLSAVERTAESSCEVAAPTSVALAIICSIDCPIW